MRVLEIYIPELGTFVKFKVIEPSEVEDFVEEASGMDRSAYIKHVLENVVFNMKSEIIESLKMMSRPAAQQTLDSLFNGCVMLNPGLDIDHWVRISYHGTDAKDPIVPIEMPGTSIIPIEEGSYLELAAPPKKAKPKKLTKAKFLNLGKHLQERVVGQNEAIDVVVNALKRTQAGLNDENRPLGVFLFAGSSGVGKTHLARELHKYLYGDGYDAIRIDLGEYQHKHDNQKLIGSPPGYVGHDDGGTLTNRMKTNPDTVVLLDEVEKAHADIWNTFLRVFDDGMITDNKGNEISFRNTVIIMTTNLGNDKIVDALTSKGVGFASSIDEKLSTTELPPRSLVERHAREAIKGMFKPEFLNRIDEIVVFNHLTHEDFSQIAELELRTVEDKLSKRGIVLRFGDEVLNKLVEEGVDSIRGARGMIKVRRDKIENMLADVLIESRCPRGTIFELTTFPEGFGVDIKRPKRVMKTKQV